MLTVTLFAPHTVATDSGRRAGELVTGATIERGFWGVACVALAGVSRVPALPRLRLERRLRPAVVVEHRYARQMGGPSLRGFYNHNVVSLSL